VLAGLGLGVVRVVGHERHELEHRAGPARIAELRGSDPHATAQTVRLTEVDLEKGDRVLVELCAASAAPRAAWEGALHAVAWIPEGETLLFRTPIGAGLGERQRGPRRCWTVGILTMPREGRVAIELFWPEDEPRPEVARAPLDVRVAAYTLPGGLDRTAIALLALGVLLVVASLARPAPAAAPRAASAPDPNTGLLTAIMALVLLGAVSFASGLVSGGATGLVASALVLAIAQLAIASVLSRRLSSAPLLDRLALHRAPRFGAWAAVLVAVVGLAAALGVPALLPPRGVAPLEAAIAWPSGKLAVGLVALLVPPAEELFFRGLLFGALRPRLGAAGAVLGTSLLFVAAHVPQNLGNPGALIALGVTGLMLGSLRAAAGALWPTVLAHVLYNVALVAAGWL
jgi:membrane protease YdiL (CAAX protease family)